MMSLGDVMKRFLIPLILASLIGFCLAKFLFMQYDGGRSVTPVLGRGTPLYLIMQGVYSSKEEMEKKVTSFTQYIYSENDGQFYAYIGVTAKKENADKLLAHFKGKGYPTEIKETTNKNESFLNILEQYDSLLEQTSDTKTIDTICSQVLGKYKEGEKNDSNNQTTSQS